MKRTLLHTRAVAGTAPRAPISNLCFPDEVWCVHIFPLLPPLVRLRCARVNAAWKAALSKISLTEVTFETEDDGTLGVTRDGASSGMAFSCVVHDARDFISVGASSLAKWGISLSHLVSLYLSQSDVPAEDFSSMLRNSPSLHFLNIRDASFRGEPAEPLMFPPNLVTLKIGHVPWCISRVSFSQLWKLRKLFIDHQAERWEPGALASLAPSLRHLTFNSFGPNDGRHGDLHLMTNLEFLSFHMAEGLSDFMLAPLVRLKGLELYVVPNEGHLPPPGSLTGVFLQNLQRLEYLRLSGNQPYPFDHNHIARATQLSHLSIEANNSFNTRHLRSFAHQLKVFSVSSVSQCALEMVHVFAEMDPALRKHRQVVRLCSCVYIALPSDQAVVYEPVDVS